MSYTEAEIQSLSEGALHRTPGQRGGEHIRGQSADNHGYLALCYDYPDGRIRFFAGHERFLFSEPYRKLSPNSQNDSFPARAAADSRVVSADSKSRIYPAVARLHKDRAPDERARHNAAADNRDSHRRFKTGVAQHPKRAEQLL